MNELQFDQYQFAGRRHRPVEAEFTQDGWTSNGVAFEDFTRMTTVNSSVPRRAPRWTPAFAADTKKLRRVLLHRGRMYLYGNAASPRRAWKTINAAATRKALERLPVFFQNCPAHKRCESEAHIAAVKRAGGYLELQAAIAYRAWRLGQDSVAIGESLGMSPQSVRVNLQRLCEIARHLGCETFPPHHSRRKPLPRKTKGGPQAA